MMPSNQALVVSICLILPVVIMVIMVIHFDLTKTPLKKAQQYSLIKGLRSFQRADNQPKHMSTSGLMSKITPKPNIKPVTKSPGLNPKTKTFVPDVCPENMDKSSCKSFYAGIQCRPGEIMKPLKCKTSGPISALLSVLVLGATSKADLEAIIISISKKYSGTFVVDAFGKVNFTDIKTKYILVLDNTTRLSIATDLERQIRMITEGKAEIAAGAHVNKDLRAVGCYDMQILPYTVKLIEGYRRSFNSCQYCGYISGPFVARPQTFLKILSNEQNQTTFNFDRLTFFFKARQLNVSIMNCPDSVYHNTAHLFDVNDFKSHFFRTAKTLKLNRISLKIFSTNQKVTTLYSCKEVGLYCGLEKGIVLPPCCFDRLNRCLTDVLDLLEKHNITHGVTAGTLLGSVKFQRILHWDVDFDVLFSEPQSLQVFALAEELKKKGHTLTPQVSKAQVQKCHDDGQKSHCTYIHIHCGYRKMFIELWGDRNIGAGWNEPAELAQLPFVRVANNGRWLPSASVNPARSARIIYLDDIFAHMEHPSKFTKGESVGLISGQLPDCPKPGFHGCSNSVEPYGSLIFQEVYLPYVNYYA